jgi:hypothetical protein
MSRWDEDPWAEQEAGELAGFDADLEMGELAAAGDAVAAARRAGRCPHQSSVGYSGGQRSAQQEGMKRGQVRCTDGCGRTFGADDEWWAAMEEAMYR